MGFFRVMSGVFVMINFFSIFLFFFLKKEPPSALSFSAGLSGWLRKVAG